MESDIADALQPVFLEARDDYWTIHVPGRVSMENQRSYRLVSKATAEQLSNAVYCEDCFPDERTESEE